MKYPSIYVLNSIAKNCDKILVYLNYLKTHHIMELTYSLQELLIRFVV